LLRPQAAFWRLQGVFFGLALWSSGPKGQTKQKSFAFLRRAEQTCELRNIAPQLAAEAPKIQKKSSFRK